MIRTIRNVFVGDTWFYPDLVNLKCGGVCTISKINRRDRTVSFTDGGWDNISDVLKQVLLGRIYKKGDENKVVAMTRKRSDTKKKSQAKLRQICERLLYIERELEKLNDES